MKLYDIPVNTLVELHFIYLDEKHMINAGIIYKYADTVYVTGVKSAGKTIPAKRLKNFKLIFKTNSCIYSFNNLSPRSVSYCGQNLYAIQTTQDAQLIYHKNALRLFIGSPICAKITVDNTTKQINCVLKDISMTGMNIVTIAKIDEYAKIEVSFRTNESQVETLIASIVHTREFKNGSGFMYACEFEMPNEIIGNYIMKRTQMVLEQRLKELDQQA